MKGCNSDGWTPRRSKSLTNLSIKMVESRASACRMTSQGKTKLLPTFLQQTEICSNKSQQSFDDQASHSEDQATSSADITKPVTTDFISTIA